MARVLEALKQADVRHSPVPAPRAFRPEPEASADPTSDETVPFIEVGFPRTTDKTHPNRGETEPPRARKADERKSAEPGTPLGFLQVRFQPVLPEPAPLVPQRFATELVAYYQPEHPVSEQYRLVQADLAAQLPAEQPHVLLFTSALPRAGTTTVLLNLAVTYARRGQGRVALVDANFQRPAVAERLGLPPAPGLHEVLAGTVPLTPALRETEQANLHVLTAGTIVEDSSRLLAGEAMRAVLRALRGRFQWVLVDAPCWAGRPEVVALGAACDAVYLVLPQAQAETPAVQEVLQEMPRHGSPLRGRILTQL